METQFEKRMKAKEIKPPAFYHLPPTGVAIQPGDVVRALQAVFNPESARQEFVSSLSRYIGNPNCFIVNSGRAALLLILLSLKNRSRKEKVILPAYSCSTVAQAVIEAGLQPVFCDVIPDTLGMDAKHLETLVDNQTLAIIPTHLYGISQDVSDLIDMGRQTGIYILEDAAQSFGAEIKGKRAGALGDFGFYSLGRGKCIPAGHGGVIVVREEYAADIQKIINETTSIRMDRGLGSLAEYLAYGLATTPLGWWFIVRSPLNPAETGMNGEKLRPINPSQLAGSLAGIGASILTRINQINTVRRQNALVLTQILGQYPQITLPAPSNDSGSVFLRYPIVMDTQSRAEQLFRKLSAAGIGVSKSYTRTLPEIFHAVDNEPSSKYPGAKRLADCLLTLPTQYLSKPDLMRIESAISSSLA